MLLHSGFYSSVRRLYSGTLLLDLGLTLQITAGGHKLLSVAYVRGGVCVCRCVCVCVRARACACY